MLDKKPPVEKRGGRRRLHRPFSLVGNLGRRKKGGDGPAFQAPVRLHRDN